MNLQRSAVTFFLLILASCVFSPVVAADGKQTYLVAYAKFKPDRQSQPVARLNSGHVSSLN